MIDEALKQKIKGHYDKGEGSIQDIARVYRVSVPDVLDIIGLSDLATVEIDGDLIDDTYAGPGATMNRGSIVPVPFTTD